QVQRVLALDVARRDVVADGVAGDLTMRGDQHGDLRLGNVPGRVAADADGSVVAAHARGRALEEQLGTLGGIDLVVEIFRARRLLHTGDAAAFVRHAGGPHL